MIQHFRFYSEHILLLQSYFEVWENSQLLIVPINCIDLNENELSWFRLRRVKTHDTGMSFST